MRLDAYIFTSGRARSRSFAAELIKNGLVKVDGKVITKPSYEIEGDVPVEVGELYPFVGRGGVKLDFALDKFGVNVEGMTALDVGASTGGFTDCLLRRGASKVYAVDSGHGQLDGKLAADSRVVNLEGVNAKELSRHVPVCGVAVCDVSFISQTLIIPEIVKVLDDSGVFITLIKPQFECGRHALGKGGIVKDKKYHKEAVEKVVGASSDCGLTLCSLAASPVKGGDGNREFLALFARNGAKRDNDQINEVVK